MAATNSGIGYSLGWKRGGGASVEALKNSAVTTTSSLNLRTHGNPILILPSPANTSFFTDGKNSDYWVVWAITISSAGALLGTAFYDPGITHANNTMDSAVFNVLTTKGKKAETIKFPQGIKITSGFGVGVDRLVFSGGSDALITIHASRVTAPQ